MFSNITLNSPWYYYLISLTCALALAFWLYARNPRNKDTPALANRALFLLRFLSTALIVLLLLHIFLKRVLNQTENPIILLAIDNSNSMVSASDSAMMREAFIDNCIALKNNVSEKYAVKTILFGQQSGQSDKRPDFTEKETDLDNLLKDVENNYAGQNVGALIIASDGIYNRGNNPIYSTAKLGFPIYALACGDTSEKKDTWIQKINHNQVAYHGNNFPVEVVVNAKKLKNRDLTVSISQNGVLKGEQVIRSASDNFSGVCGFTLSAGGVGPVKYLVSVKRVEGEKNTANNEQSFVIDVIDNRDKILLLANCPHPDVTAILDALAGFGNYELEYGMYDNFTKPLQAYSMVILHGFGSGQQNLMNECRNKAIPFWIVNPLTAENLPGVKLTVAMNRYNESEPLINESFTLFGISESLKKFTRDLPAVKTFFGSYALNNASNSLMNQKIGSVETDNPILLFSEQNGLKYGLFLGDGLWRWKLRDFAEHNNHLIFNELIAKTIQYLVVKSDKSFFRISPPKIVNENEAVQFGAEVYNKSYEAITVPDVNLVLRDRDNKTYNYTFSKSGSAYRLDMGRLAPGDYAYEANVKVDNQLLVKKGSFTVKEIFSEKINTVANHQVLYQLCNRSNGKLYYPTQIQQLQEELLANETIKPVTYSQNTVLPLIELKWLFVLIAILLAAEWLIRKRFLHI